MITDKDVMYIYSEVINQMEPRKILDVGMFYKAIGAVSRRILEMEVPEDCYITGVETDSISWLNVYETIYDEIVWLMILMLCLQNAVMMNIKLQYS